MARERFKISKRFFGALELLSESALGTADFIRAFLNAGYGASYHKLGYEINKIERERNKAEFSEQQKQNLYNLLFVLKRDGLIERKDEKRWGLTQKGIEKFKKLKERILPTKIYQRDLSVRNEVKIIVFDIPEDQRFKRDWFRRTLSALGFTMLQKSVWIGKVGLPEEFIEDLHQMNLNSYIEIFAITKRGTLKTLS